MKFVTVREIRNQPTVFLNYLKKEKDLVLTSKGKPVALLTGTDEDHFTESLSQIRGMRFMAAMKRSQEKAVKLGLDKLSDKEIDKEIRRSRRQKA